MRYTFLLLTLLILTACKLNAPASTSAEQLQSSKQEKKEQSETLSQYPVVLDASLVGSYPASTYAGGGLVWDEVLEYRVWCYPGQGAPDENDGNDYYYAFEHFDDALAFSKQTNGAEEPMALVLQEEYIDEDEQGEYVHIKEERITEWPVEFLSRPRRSSDTIPNFMSPDAPRNRLEILRGTAN